MAYAIAFGRSVQSGLASTTVVAFFPIDDEARAAVTAAMAPGESREQLPNDPPYTHMDQQRGRPRPFPRYRYAGDAAFAYFKRLDSGEFEPRTATGLELIAPSAPNGSKPARPPVRLGASTLARSFVGGQVFVDLSGANKWTLGTVVGDGTVVMGPGGAPVAAATVAAEVIEASRSGLARPGSLSLLYTADDGVLYLGGGAGPVARALPPTTAAAIALLPRDGRLVAFQNGSTWSVVEWK